MNSVASLQAPRFGALGVYAVLYLAFIYIPVLFLPLFSFNDSIYIAFPLKGFTLQWYVNMANSDGLMTSVYNSLRVGAVVAVLATTLGTFAAKAVTRYKMPGRGPVITFIMLPLVIPGIIMGIALLIIANMTGLGLSLYTVGVGHLLVSTPFAMLIMVSRLEGFDKNLEEASQDLGESAWSTFWRVTFPLALPGIIASLLLSFTISFDEFILAFFLSGTNTTLPVYIWGQLRFPTKLPTVLALGTCILVISFFVVTFAEWFRRRGVSLKTSSGI
ncbi:MAG: ABC transporter permease [Alphaproteobacteria bacterium]|jgi:spermidine/putrescine transport system permease protein